MSSFLRFIGMMNAAIWFGGAVFFTFVAAPAIFSAELLEMLKSKVWQGLIAQIVVDRYFILQYWCGAIAIAHFLAEWLYLGKAWNRWIFTILISLFVLSVCGGALLQPKLNELFKIKYGRPEAVTPAQRKEAEQSFGRLHGVSMVGNLIMLGGLVFYIWRFANPPNGPRFTPTSKFRS